MCRHVPACAVVWGGVPWVNVHIWLLFRARHRNWSTKLNLPRWNDIETVHFDMYVRRCAAMYGPSTFRTGHLWNHHCKLKNWKFINLQLQFIKWRRSPKRCAEVPKDVAVVPKLPWSQKMLRRSQSEAPNGVPVPKLLVVPSCVSSVRAFVFFYSS